MAAVVQLPTDDADMALDWAKSNCPNFITVGGAVTTTGPMYEFYFVPGSPDITLFSLRWGGTFVDLEW